MSPALVMSLLALVTGGVIVGGARLEKTVDLGDGHSLTVSILAQDREEDNIPDDDDSIDVEDDEDSEIDDGEDGPYDPSFDELITHDCQNIREFNKETIKEDMGRFKFNGHVGFIKENEKRKKHPWAKWNHAYGIPILGRKEFTDDSMKRACYLIRFLFAENEHFRRYAYKSRMYIKGEVGGFCCPPNVGNRALSCACHRTPYIEVPEHEIGHWWLKHVLGWMVRDGKLTLPDFVGQDNWPEMITPVATWGKHAVKKYKKQGEAYSYIWNSYMSRIFRGEKTIDKAIPGKNYAKNWHHFFLYGGTQFFHSFVRGGEKKTEQRRTVEEKKINTYNLMMEIWPCNNRYISVCEDSNYGMTKGLAQTLMIGQQNVDDPTKMDCKDLDKAEITMAELLADPGDDYKNDQSDLAFAQQQVCQEAAAKPGWVDKKPPSLKKLGSNPKEYNKWKSNKKIWSTEDTLAMARGVLMQPLKDSSEWAWFLRKCCAKSAKDGLDGFEDQGF